MIECSNCKVEKSVKDFPLKNTGIGGRFQCHTCFRSIKGNGHEAKCRECAIIKPIYEYNRDRRSARGYRRDCKQCQSLRRGSEQNWQPPGKLGKNILRKDIPARYGLNHWTELVDYIDGLLAEIEDLTKTDLNTPADG